MAWTQISRMQVLVRKALEAIPAVVMHPNQLIQAARGVHWATLNMIDKPWLKGLDVRTVIDVGANTGQFASAARAIYPDALIYSFEPVPNSFHTLEARFSADSLIQAFNVAISDNIGTGSMNLNHFSESSSLLNMADKHKEAFPWTSPTMQIQVEFKTLDSFAAELSLVPAVLLKIDVQGSEDRVLRGAERLLQQCEHVLVETSFSPLYEGEPLFDDIYVFLRSRGFIFKGFVDQLAHPKTGEILQGDAFFVRAKE